VRVRYAEWKGWVYVGKAPLAAAPDPALPDPNRLQRVRELLGDPPVAKLGPFDLYTDVENRPLLRSLSAVADELPGAYRRRFGLDPGTVTREVVVIFAHDEDYRAYETTGSAVASDVELPGRASRGIAVLVGDSARDDVAAVLVHELTHLLNHRVLATPPPPWLDEGMANDLSFCRIEDSGRLQLGSLDGRAIVIEEPVYRPGGWLDVDASVHLSGPVAALAVLAERWEAGQAPRLALLLDLLRGEFMDPADRQVRFDASTFFVRYLLAEHRAGFEVFLGELSRGGSPRTSTLLALLGVEIEELERRFGLWLLDRAASGRRQVGDGSAPDP